MWISCGILTFNINLAHLLNEDGNRLGCFGHFQPLNFIV